MGAYDINGNSLNALYSVSASLDNAYDVNGNVIWTSDQDHVSRTYNASMLFDLPDIGSGTQGIACDSLSQTIAQLYGGKIVTIDISTGTYTQRASSLLFGHGSTGQFAPTKLSQADLFPPLYISTQNEQEINSTMYTMFLEVYVGESSSTINRVFYVPFDGQSEGDGYTLFAFDFANGIVYAVYFSGYYTTTGTGKITAYSLNSFTSFPDGSYSDPPQNGYMVAGTSLDSWSISYIEQVQAITFFDGLIGLLSDQPTESGRVIFYDPVQKSTYLTLNWIPTPYEREGISFILNPVTNRHDMILSRRASGVNEYYRYQFI